MGQPRAQWMAERAHGSYSLAILTSDGVVAVRGPVGNRPLALCSWTDSDGSTGWAVASESCAFGLMGARLVRDIAPGELILLRPGGVVSLGRLPSSRRAFCAFEFIYIARPDTIIGGRTVHEVRKAIGAELAAEQPVDADMVISVPDSGPARPWGTRRVGHSLWGRADQKSRRRPNVHSTDTVRAVKAPSHEIRCFAAP